MDTASDSAQHHDLKERVVAHRVLHVQSECIHVCTGHTASMFYVLSSAHAAASLPLFPALRVAVRVLANQMSPLTVL